MRPNDIERLLAEIPLREPRHHEAIGAAIDFIRSSKGLTSEDVSWLPPGDHFVMVAERDSREERRFTWDAFGIPHLDCTIHQPLGPITWEHYLGEHTSREQIAKRSDQFGSDYGRKAIAKLVFVRADL